MSLFVASLNSGSNGNCYYIGNNNEAVLVDVGISCGSVEKRMNLLELDPNKLKAVFITHEHTDHISGLPGLVKKYRIPVYITAATYRGTGFLLDHEIIYAFTAFEPVQVGSLSVTAFPKWHDAADPHSIIISDAGITAGIFTDIGTPCKHVIQYFKQCHAVFLETNYDDEMLLNSRYPVFLRNRISGRQGHLSNAQAVELFVRHRPAFMTHLFFSHVSKENNDPAIVEALFRQYSGGINIIHAPRDRSTAIYHIVAVPDLATPPVLPALRKKQLKKQSQLSLF